MIEAEELINGFARCTRYVLEAKIGVKTGASDCLETLDKLALSADISSLHRLTARIEEGLDMLGRYVNISTIFTTIFYEINDTFRKKQSRQQRHYCL